VSPATDRYAVGVIAYEMISGRPPFSCDDAPMAVMWHHINDDPPQLVALRPDVPTATLGWVARLMAKEPDDRFDSATTAWTALEDIVERTLGPRWRRVARLDAVGLGDSRAGAPLTPAAFDHAPAPSAGVWGSQTPTPAPAAEDDYVSYVLPDPERPTTSDDLETPLDASGAILPTPRSPHSPGATREPPAPPPGPWPPPVSAGGVAPEAAPPGTASGPWRLPVSAGGVAPEIAPVSPPGAAPMLSQQWVPPTGVALAFSPSRSSGAEPAAGVPSAGALAPTLPPRRAFGPVAPALARPRRRARALVIVGGAMLVAAGLGAVAGSATRPRASAPATPTASVVTSGDLRLEYRAPWRMIDAGDGLLGLRLHGAVAVGNGSARAYAGMTDAQEPTLLPATFLERLNAFPAGERVVSNGMQALRYRGLRPRGAATALTILATPASAGVATVVCTGPAAACDTITTALRLRKGSALALGPSATYAAALDAIVDDLNAAHARAIRTLGAAKRPSRQAAAARAAASAFADARTALAAVPVEPQRTAAHTALTTATAGARDGYRALATAVTAGRREDYTEARTRALRAESAVARAVHALEVLGYEVTS
jgi:hypothetical protein